eukprot:m.117698 g.117698  ORF g.117698 m.117698 type:complete len:108 (+) comp37624_c0_seq5:441-764(+)
MSAIEGIGFVPNRRHQVLLGPVLTKASGFSVNVHTYELHRKGGPKRLLPKTKHCESRILCRKGRGLRKGEASLKTKTEGRNAPSRLLPACSFHMRSLYVKVFQFKTR